MRRRVLEWVAVAIVAVALGAVPLIFVRSGERSDASFGAAEDLGRNRLQAAVLDADVGAATEPFVVSGLAPGTAVVATLEVVNGGTFPLSWTARPDESGSPLVEALEVVVAEAAACEGPTERPAPTTPVESVAAQSLAVGARGRACVVVWLPLAAPDHVQGETGELTVIIDAVQLVEGAIQLVDDDVPQPSSEATP